MNRDGPQDNSLPALWDAAKNWLRWLYALCGGPSAIAAEPRLSREERRRILLRLRPLEALVRRLLIVEAARLARTLRIAAPEQRKPGGSRHLSRTSSAHPRASGNPERYGQNADHAALDSRLRGNEREWEPRNGPGANYPALKHAPNQPTRRVIPPDTDDSKTWPANFSPLPRSAAARPPAEGVPERLLPKVRSLDGHANVLATERLALDAALQQERLERFSPPQDPAPEPQTPRPAGNAWPLARRIEALIRVLENPEPYARRLALRLTRDPARVRESFRPPPPEIPGGRPRHGDDPLRLAHDRAVGALAPFDTS